MLWIAGYPKSGTTWLKYIVGALLYRTNKIKSISKLIPNAVDLKGLGDGVYKILHNNPPKGDKLYIVRHPVDICVSGINYVSLPSGKIDVNGYVKQFIKKEGNTIRDYGSWNSHVKNWIPHSFWVRYEDLLNDTRTIISKISCWLDEGFDNIDYAVEATQFDTMKNLELEMVKKKKKPHNVFFNPKHKGYKKGMAFMNRGQSGYAKDILSEKQIKAICDRFAEGMEIAGYESVY